MATKYAQHLSTKITPQSEAIPGKTMVENSAGGYVFQVDDWKRLTRFLILGTEGGTYYASERKLTIENADCVLRCMKADYIQTIRQIVEVSEQNRAPKNDAAIFALALIASKGDEHAKKAALAVMPRVCRIGTHLFQFTEACNEMRGWGRGLRNAVASWLNRPIGEEAFQAIKYQQRNGWANRDLLRLCHVKPATAEHQALFRWITQKESDKPLRDVYKLYRDAQPASQVIRLIEGFERINKAENAKEAAKLISEFGLVRECVPTQFLTSAEVWEALLEKMPMHAMVRNLATMTRVGLLAPLSDATNKVISELGNQERIIKSRLHPIALLSALLTYKQGHGERGSNTWLPVQQIVDALDGGFYLAFQNVERTGKRWMLACDVSGSMWSGTIAGVPGLMPGFGAAAMALVTASVESHYYLAAFNTGMVPFDITPRSRLDHVASKMQALPWAGTDCAQPMLHALQNKIPVDVFTIYTDNETWAGAIHPTQALQQYREKMGIKAKLVTVGMTSTGFSIADQNDADQMDVVGFDTATPALLGDFAKGL